MTIEIGKSVAESILGINAEIERLKSHPAVVRLSTLLEAVKLFTDGVVRDLGHDPANYANFAMDQRDGKTLMVLVEKPKEEVQKDAPTR